MALKIIGILLALSAIAHAKHLKLEESSEDSDDYEGWLFNDVKRNERDQEKEEIKICRTDACKIISEEFIKSMNKSVNPCDNFYDYVCGGWNGRIDMIPPYAGSWGRAELFQLTVNKRIRGILESDPQPSDILPVRQAKKMYSSCMDLEDRDRRGLKPLESILMRTGGWPMIMDPEEWYEGEISWQEIEKNYVYINGKFIFLEIGTPWHRKEFGEEFLEQITIAPGSVPFSKEFPKEYFLSRKKMLKEYANVIKRVAKEFIKHTKSAVTDEMLEKDIEDLVAFDMQIFRLITDDHDDEDSTVGKFLEGYNKDVANLPDKDKIDFESYFRILFGMEDIKIKNSMAMSIQSPTYYSRLTVLLKETPARTIANYIQWKFVSTTLGYATKSLEEILTSVVKKDNGAKQGPPRWMECIQNLGMDHASSYAFVKKYYDKNTEKAALSLTENVRAEMESQIEESDWLDDAAKEISKDKLRSMQIFLGFPTWYENKTILMSMYKGLKIGYDFFENILSFQKYSVREKLRYLKNEKDVELWAMQPVMVNAMYSGPTNNINIPAADFQAPFFTPNFPDNINYGSIGCIIGHEMGHGFDDSGIKLDKDGEETKWSKSMIEGYYKRAECFLDQFNNYWGVTEIPSYGGTPDYRGRSIGRKTRGENIADTTGLHSVLQAYQKLRERRGRPDDKLPGFEEYTDDQMFFISFASAWCQVARPEYAETLKNQDPHSPPRMRVMGAVSNMEAFAEAFNCPKGSPMNPEDKCAIWESEKEPLPNEIDDNLWSKRRHRRRWGLNGW